MKYLYPKSSSVIKAFILLCLALVPACGPGEDKEPSLSSPNNHTQVIHVNNPHPSPSDGKGRAIVSPMEGIIANQPGTWEITYYTAEEGISVGGGLVMQVSPFWGWTKPQTKDPKAPGYTTVVTNNPGAKLEYFAGDQLYTLVKVRESPLKKGDTVTFIYGDTGLGKNPGAMAMADLYAESIEEFFIKVDGDGDGVFFPLPRINQPTFAVLPGPAAKLTTFAPSIVKPGELIKISVAALDKMNNLAASYTGNIIISFQNRSGQVKQSSMKLSVEDKGAGFFGIELKEPGVHTYTAEDGENGFIASGNPILVINKEPKYRLFWGDLHGHSALSDGSGAPDDYYRYAEMISRLDVSVLTDHDAWGLELMDRTPDMWDYIKDRADNFYRPGEFVTFAGYEWTSWKYGHKHVLYLKGKRPLFSSRDPGSDTPEKLWNSLPKGEAITISHHPGGGPIGADWSFFDSAMEPVVEIASIHGNSEKLNSPMGIYHPKPGAFVQDALSKKIRIGILASGDSHNGHPGERDPRAGIHGLAGIYAKKLDREGIWKAITSRRVYGTTGPRIILRFLVNERFMGETLVLENENVARQIFIEAVGSGEIQRVDALKNNVAIYSESPGKAVARIMFEDKSAARKGDYYYVRLTQKDGEMAWSSPIFLDVGGE